MAELQTSIAGDFPLYRRHLPAVVVGPREMSRRVVALRQTEEKKEEQQSANPEAAREHEATTLAAPSKIGRRAYNREYMRQWRKRNQERYREYNREYQRQRHLERKIDRILNAPEDCKKLCGYGCGRAAVETIERIDPRTWKTVRVPYCGHC